MTFAGPSRWLAAILLWLSCALLVGCAGRDLAADPDEASYPAGPYALAVGATLPNLSFQAITSDGSELPLVLADHYDPHDDGLLLIVVSGGTWCGTCQWWRERQLPLPLAGRIRRVDIILGDRDNAPATLQAARSWLDGASAHSDAVGIDPELQLAPLLQQRALPVVLLVERATMTLLDQLSNPSASELPYRSALALAQRAGAPAPAPPMPERVDGLFEANEWALLQQTALPGAPGPDPTNAVADRHAAARLGRALFFDAGLSGSGTIACASCHLPERQLYDRHAVAQGVAVGRRRAPSVALAAHARWQFWDGRADSSWAQALGPLESPAEMGGSRTQVARRLLTVHRDGYRAAFPNAALPDPSDWPAQGQPGDDAYEALPTATKDAITSVFVHAGKAIAAWERSLRVAPNLLDAYLAGDRSALDPEQKYGLQLFVRVGCMQCHWGPRLSDDAFHNIGTHASGDARAAIDRGRFDGLAAWRNAEFHAASRYSDAPTRASQLAIEPSPRLIGQFKTPALRGVAHSLYFGHDGAHRDLSTLLEHYGWGSPPSDRGVSIGEREPWLPRFGETAQWGLLPLLRVLRAEVVGLPSRGDSGS